MTLPVLDSMAGSLQHVLPSRFPKIRHYGLLSPSSRADLERARKLLESATAQAPQPSAALPSNPDIRADAAIDSPRDAPAPRLCPGCKRGHLRFR